MKILFVCHRLPYPPNRGGKIRPFNMIRHLGQKHSVTVASLAFTEDELKESLELKNYCADVIAEVVPNSFVVTFTIKYISGDPKFARR